MSKSTIWDKRKRVDCLWCGKKVQWKDHFLIPVDKPRYMNVIVHIKCKDKVYENWEEFSKKFEKVVKFN